MSMDHPAVGTAKVLSVARDDDRSYVDWGAVIAGIVLASAISLVLLAFGSAIGLSFTSFHAREGAAPIWIAIAAASWLLWVQVSSFMAGGYLTGRLRRRFGDATEHESDVRDGAHGLLVWAGALVVGAVVAVGGLGAVAGTIGAAASTVTQAAANVADDAGLDPNAYFADMLFRPAAATTEPAPAAPGAAPPAAGAAPATVAAAPAASSANRDAARAEAGRIFANAALSGELPADDRAWLAQLVATETGMAPAEAEARVDQVSASIEAARNAAAEAAETARRTAVIAAFLTAASLLVSAIGAWWAAGMGGRHRDEGTEFVTVFRRF